MITTMMMMEMEMMMVMDTTMTVAQTRQSQVGLPSGHLVIRKCGRATADSVNQLICSVLSDVGLLILFSVTFSFTT